MITTTTLESMLHKCRIITQFAPLDESILGYYYGDGSYYIILINKSIQNNERLYRCVLAEEIGHYNTTVGDITPRKRMRYRDRLNLDKQEQLAMRWATNFLIPTKMLLAAIKTNTATTLWELEDYFQVTREFLTHKLDFMGVEYPAWLGAEMPSCPLFRPLSLNQYQ